MSPEPVPDIVVIPEGFFLMGSESGPENEMPRHRVWVDSFGIERLLQEIEAAVSTRTTQISVVEGLLERLFAAYSGHFLPEETGAWAIVRRERLSSGFSNALQAVARHFQLHNAWESAARCCRRALEIDPLVQNFWYHLMLCHQQLGETAEALAVYRRCRQVMSTELGIGPSAELESLRATLSQDAEASARAAASTRRAH